MRRLHTQADATRQHVAVAIHHLAVHHLADGLAGGVVDCVATHLAEHLAGGVAHHLLGILAQDDLRPGNQVAVQVVDLAVLDRADLAALGVDHVIADDGADDVAVGVAHHQHGVGDRLAVGVEHGLLDFAQHLAVAADRHTVLDRTDDLAAGIDQLAVHHPAQHLATGVADDLARLADHLASGIHQLAVHQLAADGSAGALYLRGAHVDHPAAGVERGVLLNPPQFLAVQADGLAILIGADDVALGIHHLAVHHPPDHVAGSIAHHGGTLAHTQQRVVGGQATDDPPHHLAVEADGLTIDDMTDDATVGVHHVVTDNVAEHLAVGIEHHVDGFRRQRIEQAGDGDLAQLGGAAVFRVAQHGNQFAGLFRQFHTGHLRRAEHQRQGREVHVEAVRRAAVVVGLVLAALGVLTAGGEHFDVLQDVDHHLAGVVGLLLHADAGGGEGAKQVDAVAGAQHAVEGVDFADLDRLDPLAQLDIFRETRHAILLHRIPGDRPATLQGLEGHAVFQFRPVIGQHRARRQVIARHVHHRDVLWRKRLRLVDIDLRHDHRHHHLAGRLVGRAVLRLLGLQVQPAEQCGEHPTGDGDDQ